MDVATTRFYQQSNMFNNLSAARFDSQKQQAEQQGFFGVYFYKHMIHLWDFYDLMYFSYSINSLKKERVVLTLGEHEN